MKRGRKRAGRGEALAKSVRGLLAEKRALLVKEKGLVKILNGMLVKIGYQVVSAPAGGGGKRRARKARRGRPPGRPRKVAARAGRPRKRGRPRKS